MLRNMVAPIAVAIVALVATSKGQGQLRFLERAADAGEVKSGLPLSHRFRFANAGPGTIEVMELRASCGCLTSKLSQRVYKAGEEGAIQLDVNTLSQPPGANTWRVQIGYRDGDQLSQTSVELTARLVIEISVTPAAMTIFADSAVSHEIIVADRREKPLSIIQARGSSSKVHAQVTEQFRDVLARWIRKVRVEIAGDCPDGRHEEVLTLYTDDPLYRELQVPITIVKRPQERVTATPRQVSLSAGLGRAVPSRIVLIRDRDNQQVAVASVRADDPAIVISFATGPGLTGTVKISVDRSRMKDGALRSAVHVEIREPVPHIITIPVTCTVE